MSETVTGRAGHATMGSKQSNSEEGETLTLFTREKKEKGISPKGCGQTGNKSKQGHHISAIRRNITREGCHKVGGEMESLSD